MRLPTEGAGCALQVTYGIALAVYLVSVITPSIWGPIQIIGATAGAVIGFIIPGATTAFGHHQQLPSSCTPCTQEIPFLQCVETAQWGGRLAGLLAIRVPKPRQDEDEQLLGGQPEPTRHWRLAYLVGWALILIGILQSAAGIAGQILHPSAAK